MTELISIPWISITVFLPLVGALILMMVPAEHERVHRHLTMAFMSITFLVSLALITGFNPADGDYQLTSVYENVPWIRSLGASYWVGIDGISLWLVILTTFLGPFLVLASYKYITTRVKEFHLALLILQTSMLGAFVALDVLLFYMFWEIMLVPMYLIIGVWGSKQRIYAAVKLFLFTMVGSLLMLVAILYLYGKGGSESFALADMMVTAQSLSLNEQRLLFAAFALAFLIKVPVFPLHTWLPDAHVQAPTAGSVVLAGILLKLGTYGLIRFGLPMFPDAVVEAAPYLAVLAVIGIVYGAMIAYVQSDAKKLIAYSSVSHLGFVVLGLAALTPQAMTGAVFQGLAHGITTSGLFLAIGILYERVHSRELADYGGLAKVMPRFAVLTMIIAMGSIGVPGLVGFVGEFLILLGSAQSLVLNFAGPTFIGPSGFGPELMALILVIVAATGVILGALYVLMMLQRIFFGPVTHDANRGLQDLSTREMFVLVPIAFMTIFMGLQPLPFLKSIEPAVERTYALITENVSEEHAATLKAQRDRAEARTLFESELESEPWTIQRDAGAAAPVDDASNLEL